MGRNIFACYKKHDRWPVHYSLKLVIEIIHLINLDSTTMEGYSLDTTL